MQAISARLGCLDGWRAAGPFGPHSLLGFDAPPPEADESRKGSRSGGGLSGLGLLRPKLSAGGCGIYVNSVPDGASVYITDKGRVGRGESIFRIPPEQLVATLESGNLADRLKAFAARGAGGGEQTA